jgi:hypothetical protein
MAMWATRRNPISRALALATREFSARPGERFILHFDPDLNELDVSLFWTACGEEVAALERRFGFKLRRWRFGGRRLAIYLFRSSDEVTNVRGGPAAGFASWQDWYITANIDSYWREILRHELAHIFSARWNDRAPRVLMEGLAVWVQRTRGGYTPDDYVRSRSPTACAAIDCLLGPEPDGPLPGWHHYYSLAGSFTGHLIRQYAWDQFRRFYRDRAITLSTLPRRFARRFGVSLEAEIDAWLSWLRRSRRMAMPQSGPLWMNRFV